MIKKHRAGLLEGKGFCRNSSIGQAYPIQYFMWIRSVQVEELAFGERVQRISLTDTTYLVNNIDLIGLGALCSPCKRIQAGVHVKVIPLASVLVPLDGQGLLHIQNEIDCSPTDRWSHRFWRPWTMSADDLINKRTYLYIGSSDEARKFQPRNEGQPERSTRQMLIQ